MHTRKVTSIGIAVAVRFNHSLTHLRVVRLLRHAHTPRHLSASLHAYRITYSFTHAFVITRYGGVRDVAEHARIVRSADEKRERLVVTEFGSPTDRALHALSLSLS